MASPKLLDFIALHRRHRPHGRHLVAVGREHRPIPKPVFRRRLAHDLPERAAEGPQAVEADIEADVGHAAVGLAQPEHRAFDSPPLQVAVRRLTENGPEGTDEVRLGDVGHRGHCADVERLGVGAVHRVAGAQQAPVQILDFSAHGATLRRQGRALYPTRRVLHYPKRTNAKVGALEGLRNLTK